MRCGWQHRSSYVPRTRRYLHASAPEIPDTAVGRGIRRLPLVVLRSDVAGESGIEFKEQPEIVGS